MTTHPAVGAFLRPVGNFLYCLRVTEVRTGNAHGLIHIETERWGMEQKQPVRDGHQYRSWVRDLRPVLPGVWREEGHRSDWASRCEPLYYRLIDTLLPPSDGDQMMLF